MTTEREPTLEELEAIEQEYNSALLNHPLETDKEKTLEDWADLVALYAFKALDETDPDRIHERFIQAGNLAARAARAVRTGEHR